jgi:TnpA family transposase
MGLVAMAESGGVSYDVLAWTAEWYLRPESLAAANAAIVNYHHRLPHAQAFGSNRRQTGVAVSSRRFTADQLRTTATQ